MTAPSAPFGAPVAGAPGSGVPYSGAPIPATPPGTEYVGRGRHRPATLVDVAKAEWIKLRTLRSTYITLGVAVLLAIGLGALFAWAAGSHYFTSSGDRNNWDPTAVSLTGLIFAQLAVAVLGVLVVSGEYSSGMVRTSLAAVPRRSHWLGAKAAVFTVVILVLGEIISFAAFLLGQPIIGHYSGVPYAAFGDPGVLRAVIGGGLYLAAVGLVAVAVGALIRNSAGAIAIMVALIFVLPAVSNALPDSWRNPLQKYWPSIAGEQIASVVRTAHTLAPWAGFLDFLVFTAIVLAAAFFLLLRRDA